MACNARTWAAAVKASACSLSAARDRFLRVGGRFLGYDVIEAKVHHHRGSTGSRFRTGLLGRMLWNDLRNDRRPGRRWDGAVVMACRRLVPLPRLRNGDLSVARGHVGRGGRRPRRSALLLHPSSVSAAAAEAVAISFHILLGAVRNRMRYRGGAREPKFRWSAWTCVIRIAVSPRTSSMPLVETIRGR